MAIYKQDDIVTLYISGYGADGEGVAKADGFVFFVPFAVKGETVRAKVVHVNRKNLVFCELKEIIESAEERIKPPCNRFTRCGGCDIMHLKYEEQLRIKRDNIIALLRKNAGIEDVEVDEVVPCSEPYRYRNKIQLPFGTVNGEIAMGFYRENSHKIVAITKCFLHGEWVEKLIKVFVGFAKTHGLTAYDDIKKSGLLRHMVARKLNGGFCITVVTNRQKLPFADDLIMRLNEEIGEEYALYNSVKQAQNNVIMGESAVAIKEKKIYAEIMGIKMEVNPYSFLQLNDEIRDKIYKRVIEEINGDGNGEKIVIDAYAGVGALGTILAQNGATVYNIEIVKEATEDGKKLAEENGLGGKVFNINGDAAVKVPEILKETTGQERTIILDPPRKGCDERVLKAIAEADKAEKIYYISCNPATLTRDLKILAENGYKIDKITPYDMFPQTKHVETLVLLGRR